MIRPDMHQMDEPKEGHGMRIFLLIMWASVIFMGGFLIGVIFAIWRVLP